jgi:hypothetical protein
LPSPSSIRLREPISADLVELGGDAVLLTVTLAEQLTVLDVRPTPPTPSSPVESGTTRGPETPAAPSSSAEATGLRLDIGATEDDLFILNQSLSKLRDLLGGGAMQLKVYVEARVADDEEIDKVRARNTVIEPLEERPRIDVRPEWIEPDT